MRILIVDDETPAVERLERLVPWKELGIDRVLTAFSAADARRIITDENVDIVLCDIEMPQESGLDLLAWVNQKGMQVSFIFLTCHADFTYAQRALRQGSIDYLVKPAMIDDISAAVNKAKEEAQKRRQYSLTGVAMADDQQSAITRVKDYIHTHLSERLMRDDLAHYAALNPEYLSRLFKKETGQGLNDYITGLRMQAAVELLLHTHFTISEIAGKVGYTNFSHFSRQFRNHTGLSPADYRKCKKSQ